MLGILLAHEFGHYLLHRNNQDRFECGDDDIETGGSSDDDIETQADKFASTLLMPLDDFRIQVNGHPLSFDLLGHCADRYGVSLTAATLRWMEIADQRAVLVASRDDHMLWAKSNEAAYNLVPCSLPASALSPCLVMHWPTVTTALVYLRSRRYWQTSGSHANRRTCK